ncbi:unnamed protein product [Fusarium venenatum]|uniref:Uncharacterized protein n=1 Tax=Fusarium venenatum TaxID=56646 RepID=A0A2L2T4N8_9HYPO|nr:uncharacterized protein FVRRES_02266 [Fusarium venenatum]CEI65754.1 unnamed protein product [Fusarium venenatum]
MAERIFLKPSLGQAKLNSAQHDATQRSMTQLSSAQFSSGHMKMGALFPAACPVLSSEPVVEACFCFSCYKMGEEEEEHPSY